MTRITAALLLFATGFAVSYSSPASAISQYHSVTFAENDNGSDSVTAIQTENAPAALTSFSNLNPHFSNPGFTFVNWNTEPDGNGHSYSDGETYDFSSPIVLYAIWAGQFHTVTFAENDNGSDTITALQTANGPTALTLFSNLSPQFANVGYTFTGWSTEADGTGATYSDGATYEFGSPIVLYAMWQATNVTAQFNVNGGAGAIASITAAVGSTISLPLAVSGISQSGYFFGGWNTAANGTGTSYQAGASVMLNANETFYAQWTPAVQISFSANGGVGSITQLSGKAGTSVSLPAATSLTNSGFSFSTWNTAANGTGTSYAPGQSVTFTTSLTLFAQWTATSSVAVTFSANGGSGSLATLTGAQGTSVTLPGSSSVVRSGYSFSSWNTAANGSGTSYQSGQSLMLSTSLTLYAQWKATPTSSLYGTIGDFSKNATALNASLKAQVTRLASVVREKQYDVVRLFGYSADTGISSLNGALSSARAHGVASFLESRLRSMKVVNVKISVAGEGAVPGKTSSTYSCVEVFVQ
ncbi:MAG: hypothetical protein JWM55_2061 [Acidimicrobiaceae bacterium]|nr:hypothetical protein [Acidimicrobiaceae bacterium]